MSTVNISEAIASFLVISINAPFAKEKFINDLQESKNCIKEADSYAKKVKERFPQDFHI